MTDSLRVREHGTGSPVLVLHGGSGPDSVTPIVDHLAAGRHVLAPTHPGWDGTTRPADLDSIAKLAGLYRLLVEERHLHAVTLIGSSLGGRIAGELAVQLSSHDHPPAGVVLIDGVGAHIDGFDLRPPTPPRSSADQSITASGPDSTSGSSRTVRRGPSPEALAALAAYTRDGLTDPTLLPRQKQLTMPTLMIWGENDPIAPLAYGRAWASALPAADLVVVPGAGHLPYRDDPDTVFAAIDLFLDHTAEA